MALRHVQWLAPALLLVAAVMLIRPPSARTTTPAATDVLFVFDTTGSMSGALSEAKSQATGVMTSLSGRLPNLRFGLAQIKDYGDDPVWRVEQTLTSDRATVQSAIDGLSAQGGGDLPEAYGTAVFQSHHDVSAGWSPGAKHLVVLVADDVPHDTDLNEGVPPEIVNQASPWSTGIDPGPSGSGVDWQQELADFAGAGYTLAFVLYHGVPAYLPYWDWWAGLTGGQATESTSATPLGDVLVEIVTASASACQSEGEEAPPQCDADEAPAFSSAMPVGPASPDPVDAYDPDAPNDGTSPGSCPPGPGTSEPDQGSASPSSAMASAGSSDPDWFCLDVAGTPPVAPAVTWSQNTSAIKFRNADGVWTIYKQCLDGTAAGRRSTVGPGYIARLERSGTAIVDDFRPRSDTSTPGFINAVNGGLGTFGWHHARGAVDATPAGDDPTTTTVEVGVGRAPQVIEGRMCAATNGGSGVYARNWFGPTLVSPTRVDYTMDVWMRDKYGNTGFGPSSNAIARLRYRYSFYRSSVSVWALVTTYADPNGDGTPFVKEPKFTALTRGGGFVRMAVFDGDDARAFRIGVAKGAPEGTAVLTTDHAPQDGRKRVRWDFEPKADKEGSPGCSPASPCLNVIARSYPTAPGIAGILRTTEPASWEGGGLGLDRWAVQSATRAKSYPRDTRGDDSVSSCKVLPVLDLNGDGKIDDRERSIASQDATPAMDHVREWELGGWKSGPANKPYQAAFTFFAGWEDGRGGWDCEPLQRGFGPPTESWGSYFSYSLNAGWKLTG
jgi:von Willebrand factor type A domain